MTTGATLVSNSLEQRLAAITGRSVQVTDSYSGIDWPSTTVDNQDHLCRSLDLFTVHGPSLDLPPNEELRGLVRRNGGVLAHLELTQLASGLVSAVVHDDSHNVILYNGAVTECRGIKNGSPNVDYPFRLKNLVVGSGFFIQISPVEVNLGSATFPAYLTQGVRSFSPGGRLEEEATLSYSLVRPFSGNELLPNMLSQISLKVVTAKANFTFEFNIKRVGTTFTGRLTYDNIAFYISEEGNVTSVTNTQSGDDGQKALEVPQSKWPLVYDLCFNTGRMVPAFDAAQTILKIIHHFTGHSLPYTGMEGNSGFPHSLDGWAVYKPQIVSAAAPRS